MSNYLNVHKSTASATVSAKGNADKMLYKVDKDRILDYTAMSEFLNVVLDDVEKERVWNDFINYITNCPISSSTDVHWIYHKYYDASDWCVYHTKEYDLFISFNFYSVYSEKTGKRKYVVMSVHNFKYKDYECHGVHENGTVLKEYSYKWTNSEGYWLSNVEIPA